MTLPGYEAQRVEEMQWAFSTKQQADYDTALDDGDIDQSQPVRDPNVAVVSKEMRSDKATYGKGHEFATSVWEVARDVRFNRNFDGSSLILGWLFAFGLGKVNTTNPYGSVYRHQMYFFDPDDESTISLPVTSVIEKVSAGIQRKIDSLAVGSFTVSGEGFEHLNATCELIGKGSTAASVASLPALSTVSYLTSNFATIKLGDAAEDISTRVRSWSVAINNNPREDRGYFPGSGIYRGRLEIGSRTAIPSLVVDLDDSSDILDDFINGTLLSLEIMCEGATISGSYKHYLKIIFPDLYYRATPIDEQDGVFTYGISADEETVIYNSSRPVPLIEVIVQNTVPTYLTTPT